MQPGEVWQISYPQTGGREQAGQCPAVILQNDGLASRSPLVLTIPFSTSPGTTRYPAVIPVTATVENGLSVDSFLLVFQIRATDRRWVGRKLGIVTPVVLAAIYHALDGLTGHP